MAVKLLGQVAEGSVVKIQEGGKAVEFYVAKHDYESELNGAGRTLLIRKYAFSSKEWEGNQINAYASSLIDGYLNGDYKNLLAPSIRKAMGTTKIRYTPGNGDWTVSTLERSVFLLSASEMGKSAHWCNVEGTALPNADIYRIAIDETTKRSVDQWTRTPYKKNTSHVAAFINGSAVFDYSSSNRTYYFLPAFTLPAALAVLADGSVSPDTPLPAPVLTTPELTVQRQTVAVSWSELEGADSYTLQRKADTDADWVQVYTGAGLTFTETAGQGAGPHRRPSR